MSARHQIEASLAVAGAPERTDAVAVRADTVLIIKDKPLCAAGAAHLVASMGVVGPSAFATNLAQALEIAASPSTRLVLADLATLGLDFEGLRRLALVTGAPVIVIDERLNTTFAGLARQAGARGYVCKTYDVAQAGAVVRSVLEGGEHFPRSLRTGPRSTAAVGAGSLSPRRLEVLKCVARGFSNQEIGRMLGITAGTVKVHVHAILRMTGARNRTEVAVIAERLLGSDDG